MPTILLIDDEAPIRANLKRFLEIEGFAVQEAENGAIGMSMALRNEADMVVCDVMMPELDGFQLLKALRADARWREVPFVFLTASADMDSHDLGIALGADDYLTKPFNLMDVMALIRRRLKQT